MGKPTASCFKMIACGGDSVDHDDLQPSESKGSSDRRGWSFRKRSTRHRVLSNSVTTPTSEIKENPESTAVNFHVQPDLTVPEKTSVVHLTEEKAELPAQLDSKLSDTIGGIKEGDSAADATPDASSVIVIQTAIRVMLAQEVLLKQKCLIKLQAVVRGHLVRRHAVGTLRCVQAIIRLQALVRARYGQLHVEESGEISRQPEVSRSDNNGLTPLSKKRAKPNGPYAYVSIEKLLSNAFARQLMDATPRTQPITIKCDPSKNDTAWKWIERWMLVSSTNNEAPLESESTVDLYEENPLETVSSADLCKENPSESQSTADLCKEVLLESESTVDLCEAVRFESESTADFCKEVKMEPESTADFCKENFRSSNDDREDILVTHDCHYEPTALNAAVAEISETSKQDDMLISDDPNNVVAHSLKSISPSSSHSQLHSIDRSISRHGSTDSASSEVEETNLIEQVSTKSHPKDDIDEQDEPDLKKFSSEQLENEAKRFSRKASNPAFIAAQSKFEELSSSAPSEKLVKSSSVHDSGVDSSLENISSSTDQPLRSKDCGLVESAVSNASAVQIGGSECGTELSISSTLDSPERSDAGLNESEPGTKVPDETHRGSSRMGLELEANERSMTKETDQSYGNSNNLERYNSFNLATVESLNSAVAADLPQIEKAEAEPSEMQLEQESETSHPVNKSSPEASPRSHITVPESPAPPSTEVSVKSKKNKGEKGKSSSKIKSSSADKKSHSSHNQDSTSRSSLEQLQEHKTGKRRNSFGSAKPDHSEHGPRDSSSSNSLPSYMQATESARAKAIANGSPRSSPDVYDKEIFLKKRHSLPGSNEREGSPRAQSSLSQAQPNAKGNITHSPQERMWRR